MTAAATQSRGSEHLRPRLSCAGSTSLGGRGPSSAAVKDQKHFDGFLASSRLDRTPFRNPHR